MAKRNVDLTSKAWRDLVFEGKNKDFGAYKLRQKSESRHTLAVIFTFIGLVIVVLALIGWSKFSDWREEQRLLALQEERERMSQIEMAQELEEVPEEEEEKYKEETPPEPEEAPKEEVAQVQQTQIDIVPPEKVVNKVEEVDKLLENDAMRSKNTVESNIENFEVKREDVAEKVQAPAPPPPVVEKKEEPKPEPPKPKADEIFTAVEQDAQFPGGQAKLMQWLSSNIRYPDIAQQNGVQGRVVVKFVVEKDGSVSNPTIVKGVDKDLDAEALRVVKRMPKWQPGKNNGQPVRSYFTLPVQFKLANQ